LRTCPEDGEDGGEEGKIIFYSFFAVFYPAGHMSSNLSPEYGISLSPEAFEERWLALHKQLFASAEYAFNDVCTHVLAPQPDMAQFDHSFIHDAVGNLHLYYGTGDQRKQPEMHRCLQAKDWEGAAASCCEPGNGHAMGPNLFELSFQEHVFLEPQGRFDMLTRAVCSLFRHEGRYGMLYDVRGVTDEDEIYIGMSLAWSQDLASWELGGTNPVISPPAWATARSTCKDPHVMFHDGVYLIYYIVMDQAGYCCITLVTTPDWETFTDEGAVLRLPPNMRGTMGIESPGVVLRDGLWHLFFTYGPGLWHAVSASPTAFTGERQATFGVGRGCYLMGPFHATEVIEDDGRWWLTTDRKEETRRLNREAGRLCYRGSYEDEKTLHEGLYAAEVVWQGDQPLLRKPPEEGSKV
jgi:hypothetical protein